MTVPIIRFGSHIATQVCFALDIHFQETECSVKNFIKLFQRSPSPPNLNSSLILIHPPPPLCYFLRTTLTVYHMETQFFLILFTVSLLLGVFYRIRNITDFRIVYREYSPHHLRCFSQNYPYTLAPTD